MRACGTSEEDVKDDLQIHRTPILRWLLEMLSVGWNSSRTLVGVGQHRYGEKMNGDRAFRWCQAFYYIDLGMIVFLAAISVLMLTGCRGRSETPVANTAST